MQLEASGIQASLQLINAAAGLEVKAGAVHPPSSRPAGPRDASSPTALTTSISTISQHGSAIMEANTATAALHKRPCIRRTQPNCRAGVVIGAQMPSSLSFQTIHISSTQNPAVKHCVKLRESSRYRREAGAALLSGSDLVRELAPYCSPYRALVGLDMVQLPAGMDAERYVTVTSPVMQKIAGLESVGSGTLAAEVALPPPAELLGTPVGQLRRVLALDSVQDPGNLGTLLRTALALGWQAAVLLPGCCDPFNDKALRASRGAVFKLPLAQYSLAQWQQVMQEQGLMALAAEPDRAAAARQHKGRVPSPQQGRAAQQAQTQQQQQQPLSLGEVQQRLSDLPVCLCLEAEGQGLSADMRQHCREVSIPQIDGGELMESLNVSAAGAILMFALSQGSAPLLLELAGL